jgi:CBS domain-containing protein
VLRYTAGKADWSAHGWPTEGSLTRRRAAGVARTDATLCRPEEPLGDVQRRVRASGSEFAIVVNEDRVVLGVLETDVPTRGNGARVEEAMTPGPLTLRPNVSLEAAKEHFRQNRLERAIVTNPDGRLIGVLERADVDREAAAA